MTVLYKDSHSLWCDAFRRSKEMGLRISDMCREAKVNYFKFNRWKNNRGKASVEDMNAVIAVLERHEAAL